MATGPPTLPFLLSLKASQLQHLASLIGTVASGPKNALATRILASLHQEKLKLQHGASRNGEPTGESSAVGGHRILSIDMGIRNLAYCSLELPPTWPTPTAPQKSRARRGGEVVGTAAQSPVVHDWRRVAIAELAAAAPSPATTSAVPAPEPQPSNPPRATSIPTNAADAFSLPVTAAHAYALVQHLVLHRPRPPHTILIERQRYRSMGGAAVQEWTLRVNTLEAMLWGVLAAVRQGGLWEGEVWAVDPGRVGRWWAEQEGGVGVKKAKAKTKAKGAVEEEGKKAAAGRGGGGGGAKKGKKDKIDLVGRWLSAGDAVGFEGAAERMRQLYVEKWSGKGKRKVVDEDRLGKLDDLADCLLQGVAWVRWEQNRRAILETGVQALEHIS